MALIDRTDPWRGLCEEVLVHLDLPLLTSEAVLTEVFYFAARGRGGVDLAWGFVRSAVTVAPIGDEHLPELQYLMSRYADRPMDFADATLVHLARRERLTTIFTIDHGDFEAYRIEGKRKFRIVPSRRP